MADPSFWTAALTAAGCGALVAWLWLRGTHLRNMELLRVHIAELRTERDGLKTQLAQTVEEHRTVLNERRRLETEMAQLRESRKSDLEKLAWVDTARTELRDTFEALAGKVLKSNTESFFQTAGETTHALLAQVKKDWNLQKSEFSHLVTPVRESLNALEAHVRELEQKRQGAYQGIQTRLDTLAQTHSELQSTTLTLAQALKSPTVRGRWGEMQLRRVVELSGMTRHVTFSEQVAFADGRPDMIVHLPGGGMLPVDAKVPLAAYLDAVEATEAAERHAKLADHARQVAGRVRELGQKQYWNKLERSPDFVVMFIPNETCLNAAFEADPNLLEYALKQNVLITTPVTLVALLKSAAYGWQQFQLAENARDVAARARDLYDRMETFFNHLSELGKHINRTVSAYNRSLGSLERRLLPAARRFQEMGVAETPPTEPDTVDRWARLPADMKQAAGG